MERLERHEQAFDDRRLIEERRLFYVALTRSERTLLVSAHRWAESGATPREPSEFLTEVGELAAGGGVVVDVWADPPEEGTANPLAERVSAEVWPIDPLGAPAGRPWRRARELVRAARASRPAEPGPDQARPSPTTQKRRARGAEPDPDGWVADVDVLLAERAAARERHARCCCPRSSR